MCIYLAFCVPTIHLTFESYSFPAADVTDGGVTVTSSPAGDPVTSDDQTTDIPVTDDTHHLRHCPSEVLCSKLGGECIDCSFDDSCYYGRNTSVVCRPKSTLVCQVLMMAVGVILHSYTHRLHFSMDTVHAMAYVRSLFPNS